MLKLDHLTVIAPNLDEGVSHVNDCLDIRVPFGSRHDYMGTYNHRLQLGNSIYLEIVAIDPDGINPSRPRWFGLDNQEQVRMNWEEGRRLRGWVANTEDIESIVSAYPMVFGDNVVLPAVDPTFSFTIPRDGSLPWDGAAPSVIDHRGDSNYISTIPDLGASLVSFTLEHPKPTDIEELFCELPVDYPLTIVYGPKSKYRAQIETPTGFKELT